ncbi:MAG: hypothetical protein Q8M24_26150 [Pseudolabrys sp.]|nr:hypothetical protein [Pseudolabrys sp.]MDP2298938.1 hypothetical protein [Pseudolabrys sp.]
MASPLLFEELFEPVAAVVLYGEKDLASAIEQIDSMSICGLAGSILAKD